MSTTYELLVGDWRSGPQLVLEIRQASILILMGCQTWRHTALNQMGHKFAPFGLPWDFCAQCLWLLALCYLHTNNSIFKILICRQQMYRECIQKEKRGTNYQINIFSRFLYVDNTCIVPKIYHYTMKFSLIIQNIFKYTFLFLRNIQNPSFFFWNFEMIELARSETIVV